MRPIRLISIQPIFAVLACVAASAGETHVRDAAGLREAVASATPGTRILLAPGNYGGDFHFANLRGEPGNPVVIAAADPANPPVFSDAKVGLHLSNPAHLELRDLVFVRLAHNGLNLDDSAGPDSPPGARGVTLHGLRIADIGGDGNHDGIKMSGIEDFAIRACVVERWGTRGGSAIDLVGCHRGLIEDNVIRHQDSSPPNCTGVQAKGGSSVITIRRNRFEHAGGRAINLGGSTGRAYFRPALDAASAPHAEARDLLVERNVFVGGAAAVAFVGVDGAIVRHNTIDRPGRWVARILQETTAPDFVPSRRGEFTDNLVLYEGGRIAAAPVNVGAGTAPETFVFARNAWHNLDDPGRSRPSLPVPETDGRYGGPVNELAKVAGARAAASSWPFFAMDNGVGRGSWAAEKQASVLRELGYDGISYNYTNPADLAAWLRELEARGLRLFGLYFAARLDNPAPLPEGLSESVALLRGSGATLWLVIPNPKQADDLEERVLAMIREVADLAASAGLRVALYPHTDSRPATAEQALDLVLRSGRSNLGLTVNLAHELAAGNGPRLPGIIRRVAPLLERVTINGATDRPGPGWGNYIRLLGDGDYDVAALLHTLREIRYAGPVGVQFYNIPGDPRENLVATRRAWHMLLSNPEHP